jgi:gluconate kinase
MFFDYIYLGDRLTNSRLKNLSCDAIRRKDGKCIRGRNGNMLVIFENKEKCVILARRLKKIKYDTSYRIVYLANKRG